jgi:hypothetical protein
MKTPSKKLKWIDTVMTNFDGGIEPDAEARLKAGDCLGGYAAWNFHGHVWWEDGQFHCMVHQYRAHVATLSADSLAGIMKQACELFGAD